METFKLRKSTTKDIEAILKLIKEAQKYFSKENIPQWQDGYPNEESIKLDIEKASSYVMTIGDEIIGTLAALKGPDEFYKEIYEGKWLTKGDNYLVIHRVAIDPKEKGKGIASLMFKEIEELAKREEIESIRIDTHRDNTSMIRLIEKNYYQYCGIVYVADGGERLAFEKIL